MLHNTELVHAQLRQTCFSNGLQLKSMHHHCEPHWWSTQWLRCSQARPNVMQATQLASLNGEGLAVRNLLVIRYACRNSGCCGVCCDMYIVHCVFKSGSYFLLGCHVREKVLDGDFGSPRSAPQVSVSSAVNVCVCTVWVCVVHRCCMSTRSCVILGGKLGHRFGTAPSICS